MADDKYLSLEKELLNLKEQYSKLEKAHNILKEMYERLEVENNLKTELIQNIDKDKSKLYVEYEDLLSLMKDKDAKLLIFEEDIKFMNKLSDDLEEKIEDKNSKIENLNFIIEELKREIMMLKESKE